MSIWTSFHIVQLQLRNLLWYGIIFFLDKLNDDIICEILYYDRFVKLYFELYIFP